jgi:hypothetical protein
MSDNKQNIGSPDRNRINLSEDYEVRHWSKKFGVSQQQLREAVKAIGPDARKVEAYFRQDNE